jgi:hypothetical protein
MSMHGQARALPPLPLSRPRCLTEGRHDCALDRGVSGCGSVLRRPGRRLRPGAGRCARNEHVRAGEYLFREGGTAEHFYVVMHRRIALEVFRPGSGGLSWTRPATARYRTGRG